MIPLLLAAALADTGAPVEAEEPAPVVEQAPEPVPVLEGLAEIEALLQQVEADCEPVPPVEAE